MKEKILNKIHQLKHDLVDDCGISLAHVFLELDDSQLVHSYKTDIGEKYITIYAKEERDLFYGLLDLLQKVKTREILLIGTSTANLKERGVHIDSGRKHYTKKWFMDLIDLMALNKLNALEIHFSENLGYRLESNKYPNLSSIEHLTTEDIKEIIAYANEYYIEIIPSFDTPGHLGHALEKYPEYRLNETALDITSEAARNFVKELYDEILEIFNHPAKINIGADEFIDFDKYSDYPSLDAYAKAYIDKDANAQDTYIDFVNDIAGHLLDKGLAVRAYNDGFYRIDQEYKVELDPRIEISYWTSWNEKMASVNTFIEKGHKLINLNDSNLYYVLGENAGYTYPSKEKIDADFVYNKFSNRNSKLDVEHEQIVDNNDHLIGSSISVWSDIPEAKHESDVLKDLEELLEVYGQKLWNFTQNL